MPSAYASKREVIDVALLKASILGALLLLAAWLHSNGEYLSLFAFCALLHALILYWTARRFGLFDARSIFLLVSFLYPFTPVFDIVVLGQEFFNVRHSGMSLLLSMTFFCGFYVFSTLDPGARQMDDRPDPFDNISLRVLAPLLCAAFIAYLALFYRDIGFVIGYRTRADVASSIGTLLAVARLGLVVGLLIMVGKLTSMRLGAVPAMPGPAGVNGHWGTLRPSNIVLASVLVTAFLIVDVLILGDRRLFLSFALASLCIVAPRRIPVSAMIVFIVLAVGFFGFQVLRGFPLEQWGTILYRVNFLIAFSPANIEFGAFGRVADNILSSMPIAQFPTYADAVRNLIPQVLYPGRPEPIGVWFVHTYYPEYWEIGGGYGFNLVIEALLNLGWFGPLILGALVGAAFNIAISSTRWHRLNQGLLVLTLVFAMVRDGDAAQDECNRGGGCSGMANARGPIDRPGWPSSSATCCRTRHRHLLSKDELPLVKPRPERIRVLEPQQELQALPEHEAVITPAVAMLKHKLHQRRPIKQSDRTTTTYTIEQVVGEPAAHPCGDRNAESDLRPVQNLVLNDSSQCLTEQHFLVTPTHLQPRRQRDNIVDKLMIEIGNANFDALCHRRTVHLLQKDVRQDDLQIGQEHHLHRIPVLEPCSHFAIATEGIGARDLGPQVRMEHAQWIIRWILDCQETRHPRGRLRLPQGAQNATAGVGRRRTRKHQIIDKAGERSQAVQRPSAHELIPIVAAEQLVAAVALQYHLRFPTQCLAQLIERQVRGIRKRHVVRRNQALNQLHCVRQRYLKLVVLGPEARRDIPRLRDFITVADAVESDGVGPQLAGIVSRREGDYRCRIDAAAQKHAHGDVAYQLPLDLELDQSAHRRDRFPLADRPFRNIRRRPIAMIRDCQGMQIDLQEVSGQ